MPILKTTGRALRGWSVSARLALVYSAFALVITLAVIAYASWRGQVETRRGEALLANDLQRVAERIVNVLNSDRNGLALLARTMRPFLEAERCIGTLDAAARSLPSEVLALYLVGPDFQVRCSTLPGLVGRTLPLASPLVQAVVAAGQGGMGGLATSAWTGRQVVGVLEPVLADGRLLGILAAPVDVARLGGVADLLSTRPGARLWLRDVDGQSAQLLGPPPAKDAAEPQLTSEDWPPYGEPLRLATPRLGLNRDYIFVARLTGDLALVGRFPREASSARLVAEVAVPALVVGGLLLLGLGTLIWSLNRLVLRPLQAATRRLETPGPVPPPSDEHAAPAEIADLIRRLGATRATQEESIRLRDLLLQEAHHRIKNHLALVSSFLRLQERHVPDPAAVSALRAAQGRMMAIAATYELLHEVGGAEVSLDRMLLRFAQALPQRHAGSGGSASVETDLVPLSVPADVAVKLGLVVNELATNALKYGRPGGKVRIGLRPRGEGFVLTVADDGPGLPVDAPRGLGMTVAESLVRSVDATLVRLPGPGTVWEITWTPAPSVPAPG
ncbi:ATP-binding protein [Roseomonas sp. OT10]|uniref:sensor histidine kinase n=1 Tax=Roseomonas cutis TaxID=2897332 RepID=UPI001E3F6EAC|nr:histidine kinase dimerization/phosphoacceptor domain -containing protein [Roseomonas sp. OT10]UFN50749.1 ATP-binding protein [Roseomonas sp. OT10]